MATTTPNLGLTKPAGTEKPDISVINDNMDKIDTAVAEKSPKNHTHNYAGSASAGGSATRAISVVDYGLPSNTIQIGYGGDGISGDAIKYIAGYTAGDGANADAKIKDVSKDALKSWLESVEIELGTDITE